MLREWEEYKKYVPPLDILHKNARKAYGKS